FLRFNLLKQGFILLSLYSNGIEFIQNIISIYNFHITHHSINTLLFSKYSYSFIQTYTYRMNKYLIIIEYSPTLSWGNILSCLL
ncbi:MAG: hypothetical protein VB048_09605, partial [Bacteroidaceae bacterium]|nr:hypothetical protein [Bacteroidaceae bacterium]